MRCRVLPHQAANGPENMALDEWMLAEAARSPGLALLRTYEWTEPTLSLGYFQSYAEARANTRWAEVPLVRRSTGGGAIWHDREITYAVAVPIDHPKARRSKDLYQSINGCVAVMLHDGGLPARRRGEAEARTGPDRPFLCFLDRDAEDLVLQGSKVLGSAQRRRSGVLLQHGSLLLSRSSYVPEVPGIAELGGEAWGGEGDWSNQLIEWICEVLALRGERCNLSAEERAEVTRIADQVYRSNAWTQRR